MTGLKTGGTRSASLCYSSNRSYGTVFSNVVSVAPHIYTLHGLGLWHVDVMSNLFRQSHEDFKDFVYLTDMPMA